MKRSPLLLLLVALNAFAAAPATPPAQKLLPADTLAFLTIPDWPGAQSSFSNSSLGRLWSDPAMRAFKDKFVQNFTTNMVRPLEKELELKFSDYTSLAQGQFTLAVTPNGWDGKSDRQPGLIWIIDAGTNSAQLKTNLVELRRKWTESGKKMRTDRIRDVEFTTVIVDRDDLGKPLQKIVPGQGRSPDEPEAEAETKTVEWLIGHSGSLLIVSDAAKDVEKVLALQSGSSVPVLADQAAFAANAIMLREARIFVWVNVKPIMTTLARRPRQEAEEDGLMGATPSMEKVMNAVGLGGVQTLAGNAIDSREGSLVNISINVPENSRKGLMSVLAVSPKDASPPPFVPADTVKFDRWRIDLQKAWATIENMLIEISPSYAGVSKMILDSAGKDKDPNFDFRKQLLANLGDDVITYEKAPRTRTMADLQSPPSLTLVGARNAEQLAASLQALTSIFPPSMVKYQEREFLGRKVYSVTLPNAGKSGPLSYAASGGYVAISTDVATLEEYLRSGEGNLRPLREFPGLNDALQHVGGTGNGYFSFKNQNETARAAFETAKKDPKALEALLGGGPLTTFAAAATGEPGGGVSSWFDFSLLPPFDQVSKYFHFNVSAIGVAPDAITFKIFSPTPPALRK